MKLHQTLYRFVFLCASTSLLFGCESMLESTSPWKKTSAQPPKAFNQTYFLCEVKTLWPDNGEGIYVTKENAPCSPWEKNRMPTFADYHSNTAFWQAWHKNPATQYRILGTVDQNTLYHPTKIIIRGKSRVEYIRIDNGPFTGTQAELRY